MNSVNYQKELEKILNNIAGTRVNGVDAPSLLLHSCCAPCSSYCLEYLREYFKITVFYYNPNISSEAEYIKRLDEEKRLINEYNRQVSEYRKSKATDSNISSEGVTFSNGMKVTDYANTIDIIDGDYEPDAFYEMAKGYEKCPEGGERCFRCYEQRLRKTVELALEQNFDFVTTTLTISPLKNAAKLNEIGSHLAQEKWLYSDFKKKNGYKRSIELSREYDLYRQNYCGCVYSQNGGELLNNK